MMTYSLANRRRFIIGTVVFTLALATVATPAGRNTAVTAMLALIGTTERVLRFPYWIADHSRCFPLDRLDPTCPQCIYPLL
jgi:hypothetical protein